MRQLSKKGFTLIELLVVIAIIGLLSTLAVVALNGARQKSRDAKRVADIKQIQTALELYFSDQGGYPMEATAVELGEGTFRALCTGSTSGWKDACASADTVMGLVPSAPNPEDGGCLAAQNRYMYTSADGSTYSVDFCLGGAVGDLQSGQRMATPSGI